MLHISQRDFLVHVSMSIGALGGYAVLTVTERLQIGTEDDPTVL